jgi:hypothetical protein
VISDCTYGEHHARPIWYVSEILSIRQIQAKGKDFRRNVKGYSRTRRPTRYLLIDFGLSRFYDPANGPPLDRPLRGGDKSAPEHQDGTTPCNPFPTDVYYLGNLVREEYMEVRFIFYLHKHFVTSTNQKYNGLEFMQPLIVDMVQEDPTKRPNMDEVVTRFAEIRNRGSVLGSFVPGWRATSSSGPSRHGGPSPTGTIP